MKNLFYVGTHLGGGASRLVDSYDYSCLFEANPEFIEYLNKRFSYNSKIFIYNNAVSEKHRDIVDFYISKNNGDSSSILPCNENNCWFETIRPIKTYKVETVNLYEFCKENDIDEITTYVSDLQGLDFRVLKTLEPLLRNGKIKEIQCEVLIDDKNLMYKDDNKQLCNTKENFDNLLIKYGYKETASGWGQLTDGVLYIPPDQFEYDVRWKYLG